jgi:hypothetical protein
VDADFVAAREAIEPVEVGEELELGVEDAPAFVAALVDMIDAAAFEVTERSGHID